MSARINTGDKKFDGQVIKLINSGLSIPKAAAKMNVHPSTMADAYYRLEPVADPSLVVTGTKAQVAKAIVRLRNSGLRWERIAHRTGMSVKAVRETFTATAKIDAGSTYTGRGRHYERVNTNASTTKSRATRGTRKATPNTAAKRGGRKATAKK